MFINNVHYSGVHSVVLSPDEEAGVYSMYVWSPLKFPVQAAAQ